MTPREQFNGSLSHFVGHRVKGLPIDEDLIPRIRYEAAQFTRDYLMEHMIVEIDSNDDVIIKLPF